YDSAGLNNTAPSRWSLFDANAAFFGSLTDIGAVETVFELDIIQHRIGGSTRVCQGFALANHVEHATSVGDNVCIFDRGTGVQNLLGISQIRRRNHIALTWVIRVISSGHHNSDGISILPLQRRKLVQSASGHRVENPCQRSLEQRKQRLGFRISKAAVEFNNR